MLQLRRRLGRPVHRCRTCRRTRPPSRTSPPRSRTPWPRRPGASCRSVLLRREGHAGQPADGALHLRRTRRWPATTACPPAGADYAKVHAPGGLGRRLAGPGQLAVGRVAQPQHLADQARLLRAHPRCCARSVPPPPPVVGRSARRPPRAETTRQRYETLHAGDPGCKGCHKLFDPIGFGFEHLDATGPLPRARKARFDIDDSGVVTEHQRRRPDLPRRRPSWPPPWPSCPRCRAAWPRTWPPTPSASASRTPPAWCAPPPRSCAAGMSLVDFYIRMARSEHFRTRLP